MGGEADETPMGDGEHSMDEEDAFTLEGGDLEGSDCGLDDFDG